MGIGYDNNILRFSGKEIQDNNVKEEGISLTLDSPILKPGIKFIYSPTVLDGKTTNIVTSISYSHYIQEVNKSYHISNLSLEIKLRSYSWIKVGIRDIPKYYLRNYHDRDLSNTDYYGCTFSSQKYFTSYSLPIKRLRSTWMKIYSEYTKEYYNPHFTEYDLKKYMIQIILNYKSRQKHSFKISGAHGFADNITYESTLSSTSFDRSYVFDKIQAVFVYKDRKHDNINKIGISNYIEQRYYNLSSDNYSINNWKVYLDGKTNVWINWDIMDNIDIRTWYQYRWRKADSKIYSEFEWVEDIKSYSKHEFWIEFSYKFASNILY